ncbi:NADPH:quinone reductase-like Zn-dependent oxidoreductase [Streptomyces sp. KhCrAH-43]|uniref:NADP-dependent oxidoreductase n=1 Tax=unclassified Streptomyces TaxID=2593676 RepID=UPI00037E1A9A|nr:MULTISPECIES: NADP-dependent oxidoreductase [unclassified Streptomyces]MYS33354.1 zinc-binding dehydrogenase [Streptomyces sp. SID4920]MYX67447.1 zinc-binding dehydrogenase [Streptomyces sp. SID8373]RAJ57843.1 NADPH:quinone reductase-like Zn-dependent oxidoreductase [Streptomyces sp. KhCrAH-43]
MRAIQQSAWGESEPLRLVEVEAPEPMYGEVLVEVHAAGVNPVDVYTRRGQAYNRVLDLPFINGWDVAGTVVRTGYGVTRFRPGDPVFGMPWFPRQAGGYAEYVAAPARHFARIPERMGFNEAAALPLAGLTAWQMLTEVAGTAPGERVLVAGAAGGVGHLAVQIAKARGAYVIGTASAAKHDFVRALGADEVIDYTTTDVSAAVRDVDAAIQMFGGEAGLKALDCLRPGGVLVSGQAAWTPGLYERAADLGVRAVAFLVDPDGAGLDALAGLVARGQLKVHVDATFPLAEAAEAHDHVAGGRTTGKVVLTVGGPE